ncbi:MAG: GNAT family N-acetyltransferase [Microbacteriaceae bacterium]
MPQFRSATAEDAATFTKVFMDCWLVSYGTIMPAELIERMTPERASQMWEKALTGGGDEHVAALDEDGLLVGFIGYRTTSLYSGYISSLYVSPYAQGAGYGRLLLTQAEDELRAKGAKTARLWVFEQNEPSRRFYEKAGWMLDGTRETLEEWGQPQVGMSKQL